MAQAVGAHSTYDEPIATGGNREDLSDVLFDVSPTETPGVTGMKKGTSTGTSHDFLTDALEDPASNAHIEGSDAAPVDAASRIRLSNYTQILKKHAVVTGTQEKVLKGGGIKSEMAYQVTRRLKAIKRDLEAHIFGLNGASSKVGGSDTVARVMGSLESYLNGDSYQGAGDGTAPTGNGVDIAIAGTPRTFTEDILTDALEVLWNQSGGNENIQALTGSFNRHQVSTFTASSTRYVTTDDKKLVASIDVYDGDFHTVTMSPDRFTDPASVFLIDQEYLSLDDLRSVSSKDLAVTGDSSRKEICWETTLKVCNPLAHVQIADLTTV